MNIEKINEENNIEHNFNNPKRNNHFSSSNKFNILNKKYDDDFFQKDYIIKLLRTNAKSLNYNQNNKTKSNFSNVNIKNLTNNLYTRNNEQFSSDKEIKYKLQLQEKNNIINNLINEIDYYKYNINKNRNNNNLNKNMSKKNIFVYTPKNQNNNNGENINFEKDTDKKEFKQFHTLDNGNRKKSYKINSSKKNNIISIMINDNNSLKNEINTFKKYKFPELKKNKFFQKKYNNLTQDNNLFENINISKINKLKNIKLNEINNSLDYNNIKLNKSKFFLINSSNSNSISKENENFATYNEQAMKMEQLQKRMNNLISNLFSIIETNQK